MIDCEAFYRLSQFSGIRAFILQVSFFPHELRWLTFPITTPHYLLGSSLVKGVGTMSFADLVSGGPDCGPSNPLSSLSKRFGQDRGAQLDRFGGEGSDLTGSSGSGIRYAVSDLHLHTSIHVC